MNAFARSTLSAGIFLLASAATSQAVDLVHVLTLNLKITLEGPPVEKGDVRSIAPVILRLGTRDFVAAVAQARGAASYSTRAQLLFVRQNVGDVAESGSLLIRQPGTEDWNVDQYLGFGADAETVRGGQINTLTGRDRTTLFYNGRLSINLPDDVIFDLHGIANEKHASIRVNNQEIQAGTSSSLMTVRGAGVGLTGEPHILIAEGTFTVGVGKVIPASN